MDRLPVMKRQITTIPHAIQAIVPQLMTAKITDSKTRVPRVAVELEPNVCVVKPKTLYAKCYTLI